MSRKIRSLLFSTLYPNSVRPGHGIFVETRLRELLKSGDVDVRVVAPVPWFFSTHPRFGEYARWARVPPRETHNGIAVVHPRYPLIPKVGMTLAPLGLALASIAAVREIQRQGFDFDLIDAHYYYPDGVAAALLARWTGKPFVVTARGTDLNLIPQHALPKRMIEWAAARARASIGVCAALIDVLRDWGLPPEDLHVMRNGVDLERFRPHPPAQVRDELGLTGGPILLSVGHLVERKGNHLIVEAMPEILRHRPGAQLLLIGDGVERADLERRIATLGLAASVRLLGALPNQQLARWYSAADALILASSREGWANVLLEAMACGTPVVATRIWGTPEVVANRIAGRLIDGRDAAAIAGGVAALLDDYPDRAQVRAYAENFSWQATTEAQLRLFRQIAGIPASEVTHA